RCDRGEFASGNTVGPVSIHRKHAGTADLREASAHPGTRLSGLNAPVPRVFGTREGAERFRYFTRCAAAQLVTAGAAVRVNDLADPLALALHAFRNPVARRSCAGELVCARQLKER